MIRRLTENDLQRVYEIYSSALGRSKFPCGAAWGKKEFQSEFENGHGWVFVGEASQLEGFAFVRQSGDAWEITQLAVDPQQWGRDLAARVLRTVMVELGGPFWLEVHESNSPARKLYEKLGFREVGQRKAYYLDGGCAVLYSKT